MKEYVAARELQGASCHMCNSEKDDMRSHAATAACLVIADSSDGAAYVTQAQNNELLNTKSAEVIPHTEVPAPVWTYTNLACMQHACHGALEECGSQLKGIRTCSVPAGRAPTRKYACMPCPAGHSSCSLRLAGSHGQPANRQTNTHMPAAEVPRNPSLRVHCHDQGS